MKKKLAVLFLAFMVFMSGALSLAEDDTQTYIGLGMANPWVDSDRAGVSDATGFYFEAPYDAANIAYSYMPSTGMAQMNYTMENAMWVLRMMHSDALEDISGVHCEWDVIFDTAVAGMEAVEYSFTNKPESDGIRVIIWYDALNNTTCSLSVMGPDLSGMDTAVYAEELFDLSGNSAAGRSPVSAEVAQNFRESDVYKSYLGLHVNTNDGSSILVEENAENGRLKINVDLFRLCSLDDAEGIYENGTVSFDAQDPAGNLIRCWLYNRYDHTLCLEIEESTWEYLPAGTVIEGFDD